MGSFISKIGQSFIFILFLGVVYIYVDPSPLREAFFVLSPLLIVIWVAIGIVQGVCSLLFGALGYKCPFALTFKEAIVKRPISMGVMFIVANEQRKINKKFKEKDL